MVTQKQRRLWAFLAALACVMWGISGLFAKSLFNISSDITDLSNYFVTNDGRDLISVLNEAMEDAKEIHSDIEIDKL